jgi:zinc protease
MDHTLIRRHMLGLSVALVLLANTPTHAQRSGRGNRLATPVAASTTIVPSRTSPLVALRFVFKVGSQDDPKGKEGLAALTAAMVTEGGTNQYSYEQLLERFYPMAAGLSGDCHKMVTVFAGEVHRDNLATYVPLVAGMLTAPRFDPEDFTRLKNEAIDFLSKTLRAGSDEELGKWTLQVELYKNHPYGHVDRGTVLGLKSITLDDVKAFHREHYSREALALGVAGGQGPLLAEGIKLQLAELPSVPLKPRELPKPESPRGLKTTIVQKPCDSTAISLGFPIDVTRRDDDFYALAVANSYLGEHRTFNGKLMQDLRGKRGLNYGDYSYVEDFIQEGPSRFPVPNNPRSQQYFSIWLRPVPHEKAVFALRGALWELDRLVKSGMSKEDFEATRDFLLNYSKLQVQTPSRRLGYAMDGAFYDREDLVAEFARRLPRLTVEAVNAAVRRHLVAPGFQVVFVTKDAESLAKALKSNAPSPITYDTKGTPEAVLTEDKEIAVFPLRDVTVKTVPVGDVFEK